MIEISQLRCFVAVAEELNFSRAADRLNMTQPPLSRQISLLEHQVGTRLLERTSRTVRLTAAGRSFFRESVRILRLAEEAASTARKIAKGEMGSLSIGYTAVFGYGVLPQMVRRLRESMPEVSLTLKEMVTNEQLKALDARQLDLGLMRPHLPQGELVTRLLAKEALMLAVNASDAAQWPEEPTFACLHQKPFLMYSPYEARYFYQLLQNCFDEAGVRPDVVEYVAQIHTMLALVSSGIGVALVPESAQCLQFEGLVLRRIASDPPAPVDMVCSYRRDNDNPILGIIMNEVLRPMTA